MTVVTKADLWWPDAQVGAAYEQGEYAAAFTDLKRIHYVLPYCSVIEPFYGTRTSGKFGDHHRDRLRENVLEEILRRSGVEVK